MKCSRYSVLMLDIYSNHLLECLPYCRGWEMKTVFLRHQPCSWVSGSELRPAIQMHGVWKAGVRHSPCFCSFRRRCGHAYLVSLCLITGSVLKAMAGQLFPGVGSSVHSGGPGCSRCRGFLTMVASRGQQGCCGSGVASCFGRELPGGGSHSSAGDPALQSSVELILERTNLEPVSANL